jgi:mRNA-degrading endonuclease toxin of MazEF toxin-antitoxin module
MARFHFGQIVSASIHDGARSRKIRPVVIIDSDGDYEIEGEILVIIISSTPSRRPPSYHIKLHDGTKTYASTGLTKPSWAKCNVYRYVPIIHIRNTVGYMPDDLLDKIVTTFDRLFAMGDRFHDWQ